MCHTDVDVITYKWVYIDDEVTGQRRYTPWPDFNSVITCRNSDAIYEWVRKSVPEVSQELHENIQKSKSAPARSYYDV